MTTRVVIFGAGGHAREALDVLLAVNEQRPGTFDVAGFLSEVESERGEDVHGLPVLGGWGWLGDAAQRASVRVLCAIGDPAVRRRIVERCQQLGTGFATAIHPAAVTTAWTKIGQGCLIQAGAVVINGVSIGDHVHVNVNASVSHDTQIGDGCSIGPGACLTGWTRIGVGCEVGAGASVLPRTGLGDWCTIGAGAVVTEDVPANAVAMGVPARVVRTRGDGWWKGD